MAQGVHMTGWDETKGKHATRLQGILGKKEKWGRDREEMQKSLHNTKVFIQTVTLSHRSSTFTYFRDKRLKALCQNHFFFLNEEVQTTVWTKVSKTQQQTRRPDRCRKIQEFNSRESWGQCSNPEAAALGHTRKHHSTSVSHTSNRPMIVGAPDRRCDRYG